MVEAVLGKCRCKNGRFQFSRPSGRHSESLDSIRHLIYKIVGVRVGKGQI